MALKTSIEIINQMIDQYENETQSQFRKVHKMIDLFEVIIKMHTVVVLSEYFRIRNVSDNMKMLLAYGLRTPSLGTWCLFAREAMAELLMPSTISKEQFEIWTSGEVPAGLVNCYDESDGVYVLNYERTTAKRNERSSLVKFFLRNLEMVPGPFAISGEFTTYFYEYEKLLNRNKGLSKGNVISFRNTYAHGGTPSEETCLEDVKCYEPLLREFLSAKWLNGDKGTYTVTGTMQNSEYVKLIVDGKEIDLFPFVLAKNKERAGVEDTYFFLNDLKNYSERKEEVGILNYPESVLLRRVYQDDSFKTVMDINAWRKKELRSEGWLLIESLSASFVGRKKEQKYIQDFMKSERTNYLMILGAPGIGKSALMAKSIVEAQGSGVFSGFILSYFIRRNTVALAPFQMLSDLHEQLDRHCKTPYDKGSDILAMRRNLLDKLRYCHDILQQTVLIVIDGLDEGISNEDSVYDVLIKEDLSGVKIIYSSRTTTQTDLFYNDLPLESKKTYMLEGMLEDDFRAMLMGIVNKYDVFAHDRSVKKIWQASEGNPLYLKLVLSELEQGTRTLDNLKTLPDSLNSFYRDIVRRLCKSDEEDLIFRIILFFAVVRESAPEAMLSNVFSITAFKRRAVLSVLDEILAENDDRLYLFHESLRDFILVEYKDDIRKIEMELCHFCENWSVNYSDRGLPERVRIYPAKFWVDHIAALEDAEGMENLIFGSFAEDYRSYQVEVTTTQKATYHLIETAFSLFEKMKMQHLKLPAAAMHLSINSSLVSSRSERFEEMMVGDYTGLMRAYEDISVEAPNIRGGMYITLLIAVLLSKKISEEERQRLLRIFTAESEVHLIYPPSHFPLEMLAYAIYHCQDISNIGHLIVYKPFDEARLDCEMYENFYEWFKVLCSVILEDYSDLELCIKLAIGLKSDDEAVCFNCLGYIVDIAIEMGMHEEAIRVLDEMALFYERWNKLKRGSCVFGGDMQSYFEQLIRTKHWSEIGDQVTNLLIESVELLETPISRREQNSINYALRVLLKLGLENYADRLIEKVSDFIGSGEYDGVNAYQSIVYENDLLSEEKLSWISDKLEADSVSAEEGFSEFGLTMKENSDKQETLTEPNAFYQWIEDSMNLHTLSGDNVIQRAQDLVDSVDRRAKKKRICDYLAKWFLRINHAEWAVKIDLIVYPNIKYNSVEKLIVSALKDAWSAEFDAWLVSIGESCARNSVRGSDTASKRLLSLRFHFMLSSFHIADAVKISYESNEEALEDHLYSRFYDFHEFEKDFQERELKKLENMLESAFKNQNYEESDVYAGYLVRAWWSQDDIQRIYTACMTNPRFKSIKLSPYCGDVFRAIGKREGFEQLKYLFSEDVGSNKILSEFRLNAFENVLESCEKSIADENVVLDSEQSIIDMILSEMNHPKNVEMIYRQVILDYIDGDLYAFEHGIDSLPEICIYNVLESLYELMLKRNDVGRLVRINSLIVTDKYERMQVDVPLLDAVVNLRDENTIRQWLNDICRAQPTMQLKSEFINSVVKRIYEYGDLMPVVLEALIVHVLNNPYMLHEILQLYILCQLSDKVKTISFDVNIYTRYGLNRVFPLSENFLEKYLKKSRSLLETVEEWLCKITDPDDVEDIEEVIKRFDDGDISEKRALKQLERIVVEYGIVNN